MAYYTNGCICGGENIFLEECAKICTGMFGFIRVMLLFLLHEWRRGKVEPCIISISHFKRFFKRKLPWNLIVPPFPTRRDWVPSASITVLAWPIKWVMRIIITERRKTSAQKNVQKSAPCCTEMPRQWAALIFRTQSRSWPISVSKTRRRFQDCILI